MISSSLTYPRLRMVLNCNSIVPCLLTQLENMQKICKISRYALNINSRTLRFPKTFKTKHAQDAVSVNHGNNDENCQYLQKQTNNNMGLESVTVNEITKEIHFYRDITNNFKETAYNDIDSPYGPPLAILLLWLHPDKSVLRRLIEIYGSKGFDVVTVHLNKNQLLYPRKEGTIRIVENFLDYLNCTHKYRPYVVHGFSTGIYIYGEMMAQVCEQYEIYYTIVGNIKGCLWDSPIEYRTVAPVAAKTLYPRNILKRVHTAAVSASAFVFLCLGKVFLIQIPHVTEFSLKTSGFNEAWIFEKAMAKHLTGRHRESVDFWERSRDHFCRQKCKIPNLFFVSEKDPLSNPGSVEAIRNYMELNGIPTYQKTWQDSKHLDHFTKHLDEYVHGMNLFFSLASLFPDPAGKFLSYSTNVHLTTMRLKHKVRGVR